MAVIRGRVNLWGGGYIHIGGAYTWVRLLPSSLIPGVVGACIGTVGTPTFLTPTASREVGNERREKEPWKEKKNWFGDPAELALS